jgi:hypothetical protein
MCGRTEENRKEDTALWSLSNEYTLNSNKVVLLLHQVDRVSDSSVSPKCSRQDQGFTLEKDMMAQTGERGIALLFLEPRR